MGGLGAGAPGPSLREGRRGGPEGPRRQAAWGGRGLRLLAEACPLTKPGERRILKLASREGNFTLERQEAAGMETKVKELRTKAGMTQQQLADLVHVSSRTIISIEKGQYSPSLMLSYRMAKVFGVTVEELCCLEENLLREEERREDLP